ncbi:MAG: hypothetical protein NC910_03795 [Candidatus Omnitrophica bacterium]|nr:hypothetical protein [Candidatus Omnitrophota bacterium]
MMERTSRHHFINRISAWLLIQALILSPASVPVFGTDDRALSGQTLRVQQPEGEAVRSQIGSRLAASAGLEENLVVQPYRGFTTRVRRVTDKGLQVAKREVGELIGTTSIDLASGTVANAQLAAGTGAADQNGLNAVRVVEWTQSGLQWLLAHQDLPAVTRLLQRLQDKDKTFPVELRANHANTLDFTDQEAAIRLDTTIGSELQEPQYSGGRTLLYAVGLFHELAQAAGFTPREAAHLVLNIYTGMTTAERQQLQAVLRTPVIDHGDTWALFLEDATRLPAPELAEYAGVDSLTLEERLDGEPDAQQQGRMLAVRNHRDRWVSWMMGQTMVDLPYDRLAFRRAMEIQNVEEKRQASYQVIRNFDRDVEADNARRVGAIVREQWLPEEFPYPVLLAGRESRAFGNQAFLFANSGYALKTTDVAEAAQALMEIAKAHALERELQQVIETAPPWAQGELTKSVRQIKELLAHLGPGTGRIRQLIFGPGTVVAMTQFSGALQQLRENLEIFYNQARVALRQSQQRTVKTSQEGIGRRLQREDVSAGFARAQQELSRFAGESGLVALAINRLEEAMLKAETYAAAYSVLMQRPSRTGSEKFKGNELEEKPEQEEALRKLVRLGGQNTYMSPSYEWVAEATDIIEAAPLFIYERTIEMDGKHVTVFEVDQEGLEQTIRQMADYWAQNIEKTIDSEHLALAREVVVLSNGALADAARLLIQTGLPAEAAYRQVLAESAPQQQGLLGQVARVAAWLAAEYNKRAEKIEARVEEAWSRQNFIGRMEALRLEVIGDPSKGNYPDRARQAVGRADRASTSLQKETERLLPNALMRQRPLPAFHLLTTEAPGLVEGFIQTVLEEEMALRNVVRANDFENEVKERERRYARLIQEIGWRVIQEFGYEPIVAQYEAQGMTRPQAISQVVGDHLPIQQEVARLAVLIELAETDAQAQGTTFTFNAAQPNIPWVANLLSNAATLTGFQAQARQQVWQRNQLDSDFVKRVAQLTQQLQSETQAIAQAIQESEIYRREFEATVEWLARREALDRLDQEKPALQIQNRFRHWYRAHTALGRTTARRETVAAHNLHAAMSDPRHAYSSGTTLDTKDGKFRPTGGRKRYHLIYAPSRVNLGKGERASVEIWPQWVGVADPLAAAHAKRFYELMNFNPQIRTVKEAENLKVSENQWTAMIRAVRNVQAYFVTRLGYGDIEDLAFQFNQRGGLPVAAVKEPESYSAGPTTGYCIPKDLLFKLFVATLQDSRKLAQIGVPAHLHPVVQRMIVRIAARQGDFETTGEWEQWAVEELLSAQALQAIFKPAEASQLQKIFSSYVEVTGGAVIFHITKLSQILQTTGMPSPLLAHGSNLHAALWSNWADRSLTLPAEEVNRSVVFSMTRDIPESAAEARRLNPEAGVVPEQQLRVHFFGTYKGDEDEAPPPDVRYSWTMRAFMIMSGYGREVALSLNAEGQLLARLSWEGFRPDSDDPEDVKVTRYLAREFVGQDQFAPEHDEIIKRLKAAFPPHTTVGDITVTVVPGVSSEDLLGFSAETATLLGNEATQAQELLQSRGISVEQMRANAVLRRQFPEEWIPLNDLSGPEQDLIKKAIGGQIHPLVLRLRGPGDDFKRDLQGQDVVVFSVTHPEIMQMDPAHLRDLMLTGRPQSALCTLDFVAQGRHRVWFDRDIMLWYAAGRGVDSEGRPIADWRQRDAKGRKSVYRAFGWGAQEFRPLLGTDLRDEVIRQERRATDLFEVLRRVANARTADLPKAIERFKAAYRESFPPDKIAIEADLARQYEQQLLMNKRFKSRDRIIRQAFEDIATGMPAEQFGVVHWLSTGGLFLLNGAPQAQQEEVLGVIRTAQKRMQGVNNSAGLEESELVALLIKPQLTAAAIQLTERKGEMFSVKASETVVEKAVARRKGLALQAARQAAVRSREQGFHSVESLTAIGQVDGALQAGRQNVLSIIGDLESGVPVDSSSVHRRVGVVMGHTVQVLRRLAEDLVQDEKERQRIRRQIAALTQGRELSSRVWNSFGGTYEDSGILARLFELAGEANRPAVLAAMELLYTSLALERTADFLVLPAEDVDERLLYRAAAGFFAETIDDHFYEYNPWALDPKRASTFVGLYDDLGVLKPEHREEVYGLSWSHHRVLYQYFRYLFLNKTGFKDLSTADQDLLLGRVQIGDSAEQDQLTVQAVGASAPGRYERLWRAYGQFRELAFVRNDGFAIPVAFENLDADDPEILNASRKVNHAFLSGVGRTHYSRALMEAGHLGENIFITRDGVVATPAGARGAVLQISDAHFWLTPGRYRHALIRYKGMSPTEADQQIAADMKAGRITPKGIRVAARFARPVTVGSVVALHHHYQELELAKVGYPATDKSPVLFEYTYDKSLYPSAYNPPDQTGVNLPPEVDWHAQDTQQLPMATAKQRIRDLVRPFAEEHGIIVAKGSAESGARNFKRFDILVNGQVDEQVLQEAVDFIYEVSKGQNVTIQRAIIVTPLSWMDPTAIEQFVERQIRDWSVPVNLERHPKSWVYGTLRVILSAGMPKDLAKLDDPANWQASHWISLNSLQVATNVGRQGTLEMLQPEMVRPEFRQTFIQELEKAGRQVMAATARYAKHYWDTVYVPAYTQKYGHPPQEFDAVGVPYWWPRYLMLDFLPEPIWAKNGQPVQGARVMDVIPGDPKKGTPSRFTLADSTGEIFEGQILGFKFWLLEPNVGIGLWPNYWRREEVHERGRAKALGQPMDWSRVGVSDRIVLNNYLAAGEAFLRAKFGDDHFGPGGPQRGGPDPFVPPSVTSPTASQPLMATSTPMQHGVETVQQAGAATIGSAQMSRIFVEAALRAMAAPMESLRLETPEVLLDRINQWLADPARVQEFPQGVGVSVTHEQVDQALSDSVYRGRVAELTLDRILSESVAPQVDILPEPLSAAATAQLMPHLLTFGVVTGKRAVMNHHIYPWAAGRGNAPVNVVGVHEEWLTPDGRVSRAVVWKEEAGRFVEVSFQEPVALTHAFVVELLPDDEPGRHQQLNDRLEKAGVQLINPALRSGLRLDDKGWIAENLPADMTETLVRVMPAGMDSSYRYSFAREVLAQSPRGVIVKPTPGTEGHGVRWFQDASGVLDYLNSFKGKSGVLISPFRGNVTYQGRPVVLRFNVINGRVTTATAVVGEAGGKIASLGQGGTVEPLQEVLADLRDETGQPVSITAGVWEALRLRAQEAARRADIGIVGVDMVLESSPQAGVQGIIVEMNARPGILVFGERVTFPEDGPIESQPAPVTDSHFWSSLTVPGRPWSPAAESLRRVLVICDDPVVRGHILTVMARRHPWVHVEAVSNLTQAIAYLEGVNNGEQPIPDLILDQSSESGRLVGPSSELWLEFLRHQSRMNIPYAVGGPVGEYDLDSSVSMMRGMTETFTLSQWQQILADPVKSGFRSALSRFVPVERLNVEIERVRRLVDEAAARNVSLGGNAAEPLFKADARVALSFSPGRVRFFMGHSDIRGIGGQTINAATNYGMWALTQVIEDPQGRVVADNLDPQYGFYEFNLNGPDSLPPAGISSVRPDWLAWAEAHADADKWHGLPRAVIALIRTDMLDPQGQRRIYFQGKGIRFFLGESDLPVGKGLSSSSALPAVFYRGIQQFLPPFLRLRGKGLNDLDYAAYVVGDRAGTADMTAINMGRVGEVSVLKSFPEEQGETVKLPSDFRFFVVDSGVKRIDAPDQPTQVKNFAAFIKSMTGMGPSLAAVWLRRQARVDTALADLESILMHEPAGHPFGLLRELTEAGVITKPQYADMVGGTTPQARGEFVRGLLELIPNDQTLGQLRQAIEQTPNSNDLLQAFDGLLAGFTPLGAHQIPVDAPDKDQQLHALRLNSVIPLRQLAAYGIFEIGRGLDYVESAKAGDTRRLIKLMRKAHDGDRAVWTLGPGDTLVPTAWGQTNPPEAFFRSLPEIDAMIDEFQTAMDGQFGENAAAGRIMAAGLGGAVAVGVVAEAYEAAKQWFAAYNGGREVIDVEPSGGATGIGVRTDLKTAPSAGLEGQPVAVADWVVAKGSLPSAKTEVPSIGVIAGTADPRGLAYGVALTRAVTPDGQPVPVVFVVATDGQKAKLQEMGITSGSIFQAGPEGEYPTVEAASRAASQWLSTAYGVGQVVELGVTRRIVMTLQQILENLFGIKLVSEALAVWEQFVDQATLALQA